MKITDNALLTAETQLNVISVQSNFPEIVYVIDKANKEMWVVNRQTGAQLEIKKENVCKFVNELMSVAEVYLGQEGLRKGA
jgi:frataxin-like iron-binding protein CyaY